MINIENYIEHTNLKPNSTIEVINKLLNEAVKYSFYGVCINPTHINYAKDYLKNHTCKVITVIGFPLGSSTTETKIYESVNAVNLGADELDMVINIGAIKDKNYKYIETEIKKIVNEINKTPLKVIIETDLLEKNEIIEACKVTANAGADFVKTSTGFVYGGIGATVENVKLMSEIVKPYGLKVKASGGIKTLDDLKSMVNAGASRIGTSSGVKIIESN